MSGAIRPLPQYAFMAWCSVTAQGQLYLYLLPFRTRRALSTVFSRNLFPQLLRNSPKGSLSYLQEPATGRHTDPDESNSFSHTLRI
jgi:hypothetical protein